jgi:hypothetical protein
VLTPAQARFVIATATAAPSVHNSQPWLFTVEPDVLTVLADPRRALRRQDPDGRELLLSCGAATQHAQLAVRALGLSGAAVLLPPDAGPDVVAQVSLLPGPPQTEAERRLLDAVTRRHTDRSAFADWPVPVEVLDRLSAAAEQEGAWLQVLTTADVLELALLQAHAQAAVRADAPALRERASWARSSPRPADGVPEALVPGYGSAGAAPPAVRSDGSVPDVVLVLGTAGDARQDWVRAGRALARVLLEGTCAGLVAAPATLALELPTVRDALTSALALHGAPQMVLRTGYPAGPGTEQVGRRGVEDVLLSAATRP